MSTDTVRRSKTELHAWSKGLEEYGQTRCFDLIPKRYVYPIAEGTKVSARLVTKVM